MRRASIRWLIISMLAYSTLIGSSPAAPLLAQVNPGISQLLPSPSRPPASKQASPPPEIIRFTRDLAGDSKPIIITADEIAAWQENGQTILLLRGQVLLQQSSIQVRFEEGVARVDNARYRRTGIWHIDLFAEHNVHLDASNEVLDGPRAILALNTRGELKLHAQRDKVIRQPKLDDPIVQRGRNEWPSAPVVAGPRDPSLPPLRRTSVSDPLIPPPAPFLPGSLVPPSGGETTPTYPVPPPAQTPVPVPPPKMSPIPTTPPVQPAPQGALGPAPPGPVTRISCYQPGAVPPMATPGPPPLSAPPQSPETGPQPRPVGTPSPTPNAPPPANPTPKPFSIVPRSVSTFNIKSQPLGNGEQAVIMSGGVIIQVRDVPGIGLLDMEADQLIVWTKDNNAQQMVSGNLQQTSDNKSGAYEFFLKGHVEIRRTGPRNTQTLRADEVYYDVNRSVAIALSATLEMKINSMPGKTNVFTDPIFFRTDEMQQLSATQFHVIRSETFSSKLPSDPGFKLYTSASDIEEKSVPRLTLLGGPVYNRTTGEPEEDKQTWIHGQNAFFELENVPVFYSPYIAGNANNPLGPVQSISMGFDQIFGFTSGVTLDMYNLLGIQPYEHTKWTMDVDYLSYRSLGPALGSEFDYSGKELYGLPATYDGFVKAFGIVDRGYDILGGPRPENDFDPDNFRGRLTWRQSVYDLPEGFSVQSQLSAISDRNFIEAYYQNEWNSDINQETFVYLKQQKDNWAYTILVQPNIRPWIIETEALPRLDGYLLGATFLEDRITSNTRVDIGWFILHQTTDTEPPVSPTDQQDSTGRLDFWQELSYPFYIGPVKAVPYVQGAATGYTQDLEGDPLARVWGGFGLRASMPLTRAYPDVESDLFNLDGINHKIVASANFFDASTNEPYSKLPQLDRLNDDASEQSLRDIKPLEPMFNPGYGLALMNSPLYDPQGYALRRLVDNAIDTRGTIEVLQLDVRQRLQTKRGNPGAEHIVDWMTLDLSGSYFPAANRDNFGSSFAFLQYDYTWNVGDRTTFVSTGWVDPEEDGPRVLTFGMYFNRPDRTNIYIGYREIEPLESKAVTIAINYIFSPKYAFTVSSTYDFGTSEAMSNSLVITRIGTDLQVSFGITYNALTQTIGGVFEIVPNLVPTNHSGGPLNPASFSH